MKIKLSMLLLFVSVFIQAQVSYSVSPSRTVALTALLNQLNASTIYQLNTGTTDILLKWERVAVIIPNGWTASICDNTSCFGDIPAGSTMSAVAANEKGFLILDIDPGAVAGSGLVKVYVYQDGYYDRGDTLTWNIISSAVGMEDFSVNNRIVAYPNPVKEMLHLDVKTNGNEISSGYIVDVTGRRVMDFSLSLPNNMIDISGLNSGCYNLIIVSGERKWQKQIVKE